MIKVYSYVLGELQSNTYIVAGGKECIVVDPADSPEFIAEEIKRKNLKPVAIIATHGHFDHLLGASGLKTIFKIPFYASRDDEFLIKEIEKSAIHWLGRKIVNPPLVIDPVRNRARAKRAPEGPLGRAVSNGVDKFLENGDKIKAGDEIFDVIHTPGHTPGSICLYNRENKILFTGDLLFKNGVGRNDFSYSDPKQFEASLRKIFKLPKDVKVYPGHGEETTIGDESR